MGSETPEQRYRRLLSSHVNFLKRSCWLFDQGHEDEALRIATSLRVIFHQTESSTSLLTHLGMAAPGTTWMVGTPRSSGPDDWWKDFFEIKIDLASSTPIAVRARVSYAGAFTMQFFEEWWDGESIFRHDGVSYSRKRITLAVANRDGGAHVNATLQAFYRALRSGDYGIGLTGSLDYRGKPPFEQGVTHHAENGHLALMRLLAHEVLMTATSQRWPVVDQPIVPWPTYPTA